MRNVLIKHGPYSREKDYYLFGYTYIEKKPEENKIQTSKQINSPLVAVNKNQTNG